jgi:hypothetical protein
MTDERIFDEQYDKPSATVATTPPPPPEPDENIELSIENDPRDPVRTVDTGRPYRIKREWTIAHG